MQIISNRYKIVKELGKGGMGAVYLAEDTARFSLLLAIKIIKPEIIEKFNSQAIQQFKLEYEILTKLEHPNLAKIYDFGNFDDGSYYISMEYIQGKMLSEMLEVDTKVDFETIIDIMITLLRTMEFVHSRNIIYADIKPQNIIIPNQGTTKLIDFGLANFNDNTINKIKGTLQYMAPEVVNSKKNDKRTDIFSLGVLFYQMLCKEVFYPDHSASGMLKILLSPEFYAKTIQTALQKLNNPKISRIIEKMCAYQMDNRFSCCAEIITALEEALDRDIQVETTETKQAYVLGVPFTARYKELEMLTNFVGNKEQKLMIISGKRGVGKSKLLEEFKRKCELNSVPYFQGSSSKQEAYEPFLEILKQLIFLPCIKISRKKQQYLRFLLPDHPRFSGLTKQCIQNENPRELNAILIEIISKLIIDFARTSSTPIVFYFKDIHLSDEISKEIIAELLYKINVKKIYNLKLIAESNTEEQSNLTTFLQRLLSFNRVMTYELKEFSLQEVELFVNNVFGEDSLHTSLKSNMPELHKYCGGNPLFLQEMLKVKISDNTIDRNGRFWKLNGSLSLTKTSDNVKEIVQKCLANLKLSEQEFEVLNFISLTRDSEYSANSIISLLEHRFAVNWQKLFITLTSNEIFIYKDGLYSFSNKIYIDVLHSLMNHEKIINYHRQWVEVLEKKLPDKFDVKNLEENLLKDLNYHYLSTENNSLDFFLEKSAPFLIEVANREKQRFANSKAIDYFTFLLTESEKYDPVNAEIIKIKASSYSTLGFLYNLTGKWTQSVDCYEKAAAKAVMLNDTYMQVNNLNLLIDMFHRLNRMPEAKILQDKVIEMTRESECYLGYAEALNNDGIYHWLLRDYATAEKNYQQCLEICEKHGYIGGKVKVLGNLGSVFWATGRLEEALEIYNQKITLDKQLNDRYSLGLSLCNAGNVYFSLGNNEKAMEYYKEYKRISIELGDKNGSSSALSNIGTIMSKNGNYVKAIECYQQSLRISEEIGDRLGSGIALFNIGDIYSYIGSNNKALKCYQQSLEISGELNDPMIMAAAYHNISLVYLSQDEIDKALDYNNKAIKIGRELNLRVYLCDFLSERIGILIENGQLIEARECCHEALDLSREVNRHDIIFNINCQINTLDCNVDGFVNMLQDDTLTTEQIAQIYYLLWDITIKPEYRQKAKELYTDLFKKTPSVLYKNRMEKLR